MTICINPRFLTRVQKIDLDITSRKKTSLFELSNIILIGLPYLTLWSLDKIDMHRKFSVKRYEAISEKENIKITTTKLCLCALSILGLGGALYLRPEVFSQLSFTKGQQALISIYKKIAALGFLKTITIYNLLDHGIANFLGLKILRHGTNIYSYLHIQFKGADPNYGGGKFGAVQMSNRNRNIYMNNSKNYFFVTSDLAGINDTVRKELKFSASAQIKNWGYKISSSNAFLRQNSINTYLSDVMCLLMSPLTPLLKFKMTDEEVFDRFIIDPLWPRVALKTKFPISASRLGVSGSLIYGIDKKTLERMSKNKRQVVFGIVKLGLAAWLCTSSADTVLNTIYYGVSTISKLFAKTVIGGFIL